jgi:hypothetical protein
VAGNEDFTADELRRLTETARRRFADHPDVAGVGIGVALKDGTPDDDRPLAIRLWVDQKKGKSRLSEGRRLPTKTVIRLKRGDRFVTVGLPVDVEETRSIVQTAGVDPGNSTTSAMVRWNADELPRPMYGFLTVAHGFKDKDHEMTACRHGPAPRCAVTITKDHHTLDAWIRWLSSDKRGSDASVCACEREALRGWLGSDIPNRHASVVPLADLARIAASKERGRTLSTRQGTAITYLSYTPGPIVLTRELPPLRHVVEAEADGASVFARGTSGSLWSAEAGLTALQCAGNRSREYRRGYGTSLSAALGEAFHAMRADTLVVLDQYI